MTSRPPTGQDPAVIKVELLFSALVFAVWVYTLIEVVTTPEGAVLNLPKVGWFVVVRGIL